MEKQHFTFVFNALLDQLQGKTLDLPRYAETETAAWFIFSHCAFCCGKLSNIFAPGVFRALPSETLNDLLKPASVADPVEPTNVFTMEGKKRYQRFSKQDGTYAWVEEKYLKLFPPDRYAYKSEPEERKPIFCYYADLLVGVMMPFRPSHEIK